MTVYPGDSAVTLHGGPAFAGEITAPPYTPMVTGGSRRSLMKALENDPAILHPTQNTRTYPCKNCGGNLTWDPSTQDLGCESCGSHQELVIAQGARILKTELDVSMVRIEKLRETTPPRDWDQEIICQSCGGHTVFTGTLTSQRCPFCNTPIQRDDIQSSPLRLPIDGIIPLRVSRDDAMLIIKRWVSNSFLAPEAFRKSDRFGTLSSVYLPYFSYDAQTVTRYTGQRGIRHTSTQVDSDGNSHTTTWTEWIPTSGVVPANFENVRSHASAGLDEVKVKKLEPWPREAVRPYSPAYIAGHFSRAYDVDPQQVFQEKISSYMVNTIDSAIERDIGGDEQRIDSRDITWNTLTCCQLALPVWMLTLTFRGQPYYVFINGITGELQGRRPISWAKIWIAIGVVAVILLIVYVLMEMGLIPE